MSQASDLERLMLDLINDERTAHGLAPVMLELRLNAASEDHSMWMLEEDIFSHTGVDGTTAGQRMAEAGFDFFGTWAWGENIAWQSERGDSGLQDDVVDLHTALMNSEGHRANILNPDFEVLGLGLELGTFEGWTALMITQKFATTDASVNLDVAGAPNLAPTVNLPTVFLNWFEAINLGALAIYSDAENDDAVYFQLRGDAPDVTLLVAGEDITPDAFPILTPSELTALTASSDALDGQGTLDIRAFDGTNWSDWDTFDLRTPSQQAQLDAATQAFIQKIAAEAIGGSIGAAATAPADANFTLEEFEFTDSTSFDFL